MDWMAVKDRAEDVEVGGPGGEYEEIDVALAGEADRGVGE